MLNHRRIFKIMQYIFVCVVFLERESNEYNRIQHLTVPVSGLLLTVRGEQQRCHVLLIPLWPLH